MLGLQVRQSLVGRSHAVCVHLRQQVGVALVHLGYECSPGVGQAGPVVSVQQVWWAHRVVPLSKARGGQQAGRALSADRASLEVLVVVVGPGRAQAVHLSYRPALGDVLEVEVGGLVAAGVDAAVEALDSCRERPQEHEVRVDESDDRIRTHRVGVVWRGAVLQPVSEAAWLVVELIVSFGLLVLTKLWSEMNSYTKRIAPKRKLSGNKVE
eukprot:CAMPEP_0170061792 /NCGR_PEP_ID=MMETSP0019_2-20121128/3239_1 /TAXON_ID=98059 /ORGANISM="Dinobryon sp., Strain UTEXLB2267" /LENGTH=210 /DNA_ID=CAMNT_0010267735 /DNA_START=301 /DNA_END=933 /DNA_ORIENTATION=-